MGTLRVFLAFSVVVWHVIGEGYLVSGYAAVVLFFIISGFYMSMVINEKYSKLPSWIGRFYLSRFLRLWPAYAVTLFLMTWLFWPIRPPTLFAGKTAVEGAGWYLLLLSNGSILGLDLIPYFTGFWDIGMRIVPVAWTLGIEMQFYLAAPFIVRKPLLGLGLLVVLIALRAAFAFNDDWLHWRYYLGPADWCFFMLGVGAYHVWSRFIVDEALRKKIGMIAIVVVPVAGVLVGLNQTKSLDRPEMWAFYLLFAAAVPFIFSLTRRWRFDAEIADLSYPLYLTHHLSILAAASGLLYFKFVPSEWRSAVVILSTLLFSGMLVYLVDRPIDALRARLSKLRASRRAVPQAA